MSFHPLQINTLILNFVPLPKYSLLIECYRSRFWTYCWFESKKVRINKISNLASRNFKFQAWVKSCSACMHVLSTMLSRDPGRPGWLGRGVLEHLGSPKIWGPYGLLLIWSKQLPRAFGGQHLCRPEIWDTPFYLGCPWSQFMKIHAVPRPRCLGSFCLV